MQAMPGRAMLLLLLLAGAVPADLTPAEWQRVRREASQLKRTPGEVERKLRVVETLATEDSARAAALLREQGNPLREDAVRDAVPAAHGIDLAAREGTPVLAGGGGRVVYASRFPLRRNVRWWRYGNVVVLRHGERYVSIYAHLEEISVRRGSQLLRGEQLGTVGNTGWSTSPHLHYEVRVISEGGSDPVPVDPRIYILNYQWTGHEELLVRARTAPPPSFDPLPSRMRGR